MVVRSVVCFVLVLCAWGTAREALSQTRGRSSKRPRDVASFRKQYAELHEKYANSLLELAKVCEEKGLADAAAQVRAYAEPVDTTELRLLPLPREVAPSIKPDADPDERYWRSQLKNRQQDYAKDLYALSRKALQNDHVSFALDLVREIPLHDGDHIAARRILGFVRSGDEWISAFEKEMRRQKKVWTDEF
ncbi:MAG: hypothetical protein JSS02_09590, partial [Planctomycetes bacterium]|nr:hypothetical protein [Planctomycetota bacterium]